MRVYPRNRFVAGTKKVSCPRCSWDFLESELVYEQNTGWLVCQKCLDPWEGAANKERLTKGTASSPMGQTYSEEN
jgi:uncharacterized Zn ribbon protein